ncbi:unnamed protein product [Linum trigynum]|uniref:Uncharacterized protein n=1 Tax=Linum trigynum TaxID=586398 RepID=A0AAV2EY46_9ROSI
MMIQKIHRGRGRPRKNPLPAALGINVTISKKPRSSKFDAISAAPKINPPPPPQWRNKRPRSLAVSLDGGRTAPPSSSASLPGSARPPGDRVDYDDDDVLGSQCLADFDIPGPIPDLIDLMSDMRIFQDFFKDMEDLEFG